MSRLPAGKRKANTQLAQHEVCGCARAYVNWMLPSEDSSDGRPKEESRGTRAKNMLELVKMFGGDSKAFSVP